MTSEPLSCPPGSREIRGALFFWRDKIGEVDFALHRAGRFDLLEAKYTAKPEPRDAAGLNRVAAELGPHTTRSLVCKTAHPWPLPDGTAVLPLAAVAVADTR